MTEVLAAFICMVGGLNWAGWVVVLPSLGMDLPCTSALVAFAVAGTKVAVDAAMVSESLWCITVSIVASLGEIVGMGTRLESVVWFTSEAGAAVAVLGAVIPLPRLGLALEWASD